MDQINFNIGIPLLIQDQSETFIYMDNQNLVPNVYPNFFHKSDEVKGETFFIDPVKESFLSSDVFGNKTFVINHDEGGVLRLDPKDGVRGVLTDQLSEATSPGPEVFFNGQVVQLTDGTTAFVDNSRTDRNEVYTPVKLYNGNIVYVLAGSLLNNESEIVHDSVTETVDECADESLADDGGESVAEGVDNSEETTEEATPVPPQSKQEKNKGFQCSYKNCNKSYTSFHHLKVHLRVHTGDRPFRCNVEGCNKTFSTGFGLKTHFRTHNGERPYTCNHENCEKGFKTSGDLQKHIRTHTGERPFLCPIPNCGRSFTTCNICKVHVRTHTGERPYKCTYPNCNKKFASATNQRNHMRIHSGEKPYVCSVEKCGRRFTEYSSLYKHNMVHRQQPHLCLVCGKTYRQASGLMMHTKSVHGDQETFLMVDKSLTEEAKQQEEPTEPAAILFVNNIKMEEDGVLEDPLFNNLHEESPLNDCSHDNL